MPNHARMDVPATPSAWLEDPSRRCMPRVHHTLKPDHTLNLPRFSPVFPRSTQSKYSLTAALRTCSPLSTCSTSRSMANHASPAGLEEDQERPIPHTAQLDRVLILAQLSCEGAQGTFQSPPAQLSQASATSSIRPKTHRKLLRPRMLWPRSHACVTPPNPEHRLSHTALGALPAPGLMP